MDSQCYPISTLPGTTALFRDFSDKSTWAASSEVLSAVSSPSLASLRRWYPANPFSLAWASASPRLAAGNDRQLAALLQEQAIGFGAGGSTLANIERLRQGAAAVVTGQQVSLFGGPLLTLLKAATAIRKAQEASKASGREHVPIFWLASEDHDLAEADQVSLLSKTGVETLSLHLKTAHPLPAGQLRVEGEGERGLRHLESALNRASELLGRAPICDLLRECYAPGATLAGAFGRLLTKIFAAQGLIVMDAAPRAFHVMGAQVLRAALERADELEDALQVRSRELDAAGYHTQVLVTEEHSLLFLIEARTGARLPLRRTPDGTWKAGAYLHSTSELLDILASEPERLSPNALLRPVFQDAILPTAAYVGGPSEIAYFAQSEVLYSRIFGRVTPVFPRFTATLVEPAIAASMARQEVRFPQVLEAGTAEALALRMGARAMPVEGKRKLAAAGNALETELSALTEYMTAMSADLGRAAGVSASKMRYQMNRLRRMAANFELHKQASLRKQAVAMMLSLYPEGNLQERVLGGVWFLARCGESLPSFLVEQATQEQPGHHLLYL